MSDVFEPELELNQDPVVADSVDSMDFDSVDSASATEMDSAVETDSAVEMDDSEAVEDADQEKKQGFVGSFLSMGIYNAMLLLSLVFIFLATLNMLGVLRTYNGSFPFGGGFPWSTNL